MIGSTNMEVWFFSRLCSPDAERGWQWPSERGRLDRALRKLVSLQSPSVGVYEAWLQFALPPIRKSFASVRQRGACGPA